MHIKRLTVGKFWPVPRKGTKYLAVPKHNKIKAIALVVVMRDILKLVRNKRELKRLLNEKKVLVNGKAVKETNYPLSLFDILSLHELKKSYKVLLSKEKKMIFEEVSGKESEMKVYKVLDKKILPGKKIQLNLMDGRNIISKEKVNVGDSIKFNLKDNKEEGVIKLEKGKEVFITDGKHAGYEGKIEDIMERGGKKLAKISTENGRVNVWIKNIIAIK